MEPEPTIYLGERELSFSLGFPYAHFLSEITNEVPRALGRRRRRSGIARTGPERGP
jgi:hypothetical protein